MAYLLSLSQYVQMITIISATNRQDSMTLKVARTYFNIISSIYTDTKLLSLENRQVWERGEDMRNLENEYLIPAEKFVFVMPEYNGSFPGILKIMMDNSDIKKCWWHKKAMLAGVADGRGGNLRGLEDLTGILHYLKVNVLYNKLPLSRINEEMDKEGNLLKQSTIDAINEQITMFIRF